MNYVLDSSALLRFLDGEAGNDRVAEILKSQLRGTARVLVSAVHWGEVASVTAKTYGEKAVESTLSRLAAFGIELVPATAARAVRSGLIKSALKIPYADAFGVDLASDSADHVLVTADFDVKPAEHDIAIEFLPRK